MLKEQEWLGAIIKTTSRRITKHRARSSAQIMNRIVMETLEQRTMLSGQYMVNSLADDATDNTGTQLSSEGQPIVTLRWAVSQADNSHQQTTITFDPGLTVRASATLQLQLGSLQLSDAEGITIKGPLLGNQIDISSNHSFPSIVVGSNASAGFQNISLSGSINHCGSGGTIVNHGTLQLTSVKLADNESNGSGGAIDNASGGNIKAIDCDLDGNKTLNNGAGGAISNEAGATLKLIKSNLDDNSANGPGGAIANATGANLEIIDCTVTGNSSTYGAGIYNAGDALIVKSSIVSNHTAFYDSKPFSVPASVPYGFGGGIDNESNTLTIAGSTIADNRTGLGGGIYASAGSVEVVRSTINDNSATFDGGAIFAGAEGGTSLTVLNSTITGNSALRDAGISYSTSTQYNAGYQFPWTSSGGPYSHGSGCGCGYGSGCGCGSGQSSGSGSSGSGYYISGSSIPSSGYIGYSGFNGSIGVIYITPLPVGSVNITDSTVAGNDSTFSDARSSQLYVGEPVVAVIAGSMFAGAANTGSITVGGPAATNSQDIVGSVSGSNNIVSDGSGTWESGSNNQMGSNAQPIYLKLGSLGQYGGPTETMLPFPGSPAIGAGATFNDSSGNPITTDQRGVSRAGVSSDIGAVQVTGSINIVAENFTTYATAAVPKLVATFTPSPALSGVAFQAVISWGDGTSSAGTITSLSNTTTAMAVTGIHAYSNTEVGTHTVTVTLHYENGAVAAVAYPSALVLPSSEAGEGMELTATATVLGSVQLAWLPDYLGETGFEVERSTGGGGWSYIGSVQPDPIPGDTLHFLDTAATGLAADTAYTYQVQGYMEVGSSRIYLSTSNTFNAHTIPTGATFDPVPIDTLSVPINGSAGVLSNVNLTSGALYELVATGYFYLGSQQAPHLADAQWTAFDTPYGSSPDDQTARRISISESIDLGIAVDDTTLDGNKFPYWGSYTSTHVYSAVMVGSGGPITLDYHDEYYPDNSLVAGVPGIQVQIFRINPKPLALTAAADYSNQSIELNWSLEQSGTSDAQIWRKGPSDRTYTEIGDVTDGSTAYYDYNAASGTTYQYQVIAIVNTSAGHITQYSNIASAIYRVGTPTLSISGPSTFDPNQLYTLSISGNANGGPPITSVQINWGDTGTTTVSDVQTLPGNPTSVTHRFLSSAGSFTISAIAFTSGPSSAASTWTVTVSATNASLGEISGTVSQSLQDPDPSGVRPPVHPVTLQPVADFDTPALSGLLSADTQTEFAYNPIDQSLLGWDDLYYGSNLLWQIHQDGSFGLISTSPISANTGVPSFCTVPVGAAAGFSPGDIYYAGQGGGQIYRLTNDRISATPFTSLPDLDGSGIAYLQFDNTGAFGGNLIVVTTKGILYLVDAAGSYAELAALPESGMGYGAGIASFSFTVLPDDADRWGPYAGSILVGVSPVNQSVGNGENSDTDNPGVLLDVTIPQGDNLFNSQGETFPSLQINTVATTQWKQWPSFWDLSLVTSNANFYLTEGGDATYTANTGHNFMYGISANDLKPIVGDVLVCASNAYTDRVDNAGLTGLGYLYYSSATGTLQFQDLQITDLAQNPNFTVVSHFVGVMVPMEMDGISQSDIPLTDTLPPTLQPVAGRVVQLLNNSGGVVATSTTDATGEYGFNVTPGSYTVSEVLPSGWVQNSPDLNASMTGVAPGYSISLTAGEAVSGVDFVSTQQASFHYPPVIDSTPPTSIQVGSQVTYDVHAYSPEGSALTFDLVEYPDGMTLVQNGPNGAIITFTAPFTPDEGARALVRVVDAQGAEAIQPFTLEYTLPTITGIQGVASSTGSIDVSWNPVIPPDDLSDETLGKIEYRVFVQTNTVFPADTWFNRNFLSFVDGHLSFGYPGTPGLAGFNISASSPNDPNRVFFRVTEIADPATGQLEPLTANTDYYFQIRAFINYNDPNGLEAKVSDTYPGLIPTPVETFATQTLAEPGGLQAYAQAATSTTPASINLDWQANVGAMASSYNIYRSESSDPSTATYLNSTSGITYTDGTVGVGTTYYYWVKAVTQAGALSSYSIPAFASVIGDDLGVKWANASGYNLQLSNSSNFVVTGTTITLSASANFSDGSTTGIGYIWSLAECLSAGPKPVFSVNDSSAANTTLVTFQSAGTYIFRVTPFTFNGISESRSNYFDMTESIIVDPTLTALKVDSYSPSIYSKTSETFQAEGLDQFSEEMPLAQNAGIVWSVNSESGFAHGQINSSTGLYNAPTVGEDAFDQICVNYSSGTTALLGTAMVEILVSPLTAPTDLTAAYAGAGRVGLEWNAVSNDALSGYNIYRSTSSSFTADSTTYLFDPINTYYSDDVPSLGTTYYYAVCAVVTGADGQDIVSDQSNYATVNTSITPTVPAAPSGLSATDVGSNYVNLVWTDNSLNELEFDIYRETHSINPGTWNSSWGQLVGRVTTNVTSYTDATVMPSWAYDYVVVAVNPAGTGASAPLCDIKTLSAGPPPDAVGTFSQDFSTTTPNAIGLTWTPVASTDTVIVVGYDIFRRVDGSGGPFVLATPNPVSGTSYVDPDLGHGTYDYQITAVSDQNSQSPATNLSGASTTPTSVAPTVTIVSPLAYTGNSINFNDQTSTDGRITTVTGVSIIVDDAGSTDGSLTWSLTLSPVDPSDSSIANIQPITLASGNSSVGMSTNSDGGLSDPDGLVVSTLDPNLYPSGNYDLTLTASDSGGTASPWTTQVSLFSPLKLGNLTLPVTDLNVTVPGGPPITVSRVYDSQSANVASTDFGYGWSLQLNTASVTSTALPVGGGNTTPVFRPGDLMYVNLPDGEQHVFQFFPVPNNYDSSKCADPYNAIYAGDGNYYAQFICVDGSGAKLDALGDINSGSSASVVGLTYANGYFTYYDDHNDTPEDYNPTSRGNTQNDLTLTTADNHVYTLDASTGQMISSTDPAGNKTIYSPDGVSQNGTSYNLAITRNTDGTIHSVEIVNSQNQPVGNAVTYSYVTNSDETNPLLRSVTEQDGSTTTYWYGTSNPGQENFLAQVNNSQGVTILTATYNAQGFLATLVGANGNPADITTNSPGTGTGSEGVSDPSLPSSQQSTTQTLYDTYGDPTRVIKSYNASGITYYTVTVSAYQYASSDPSTQLDNIFPNQDGSTPTPGASLGNTLISVTQYAPFTVVGVANAVLCYAEVPTLIQNQVTYSVGNGDSLNEPGVGQPSQDMTYQETDASGDLIYSVVNYSNYVGVKPGTVQSSIGTITPGGSTLTTQLQSTVQSYYDDWSNLGASTDAMGQTTFYDYTTPDNTASGELYAGLPDGMLLDTYRVDGWNGGDLPASVDSYRQAAFASGTASSSLIGLTPAGLDSSYVLISSNVYYSGTDASSGAVLGELAHSTQWNTNTVGQSTYYAYDAMGNTVATWVGKTWSTSAGTAINGWTVTLNTFDASGQAIDTYQGTYVDTTTNGTGTLGITITQATLNAAAGNSGFADQISISNPLYDDATQANYASGTLPPLTSHTDYNSLGQVADTVDQYGGKTINTYDVNGNVIRTQYEDNTGTEDTETRTVYDSLGRVIWTSDKFVAGSTSYMATETFYNALGQVYKTERFSNVNITLGTDSNGQPTAFAPTVGSGGAVGISYSLTYYDDQGRVIEAGSNVNASTNVIGLRTGTIYYPDGQVEYTGPLSPSAPAGGWAGVNGQGDTTYSFNLSDLATHTYYQYNFYGLAPDGSDYFYNSVTDPDGNTTKTYADAAGRTVFVVYPDGSYTNTQYSSGDSPVTAATVPPGGSEVVQVAAYSGLYNHSFGDQTWNVYDRNGNLVDVYQWSDYSSSNTHTHYDYDASGNEIDQIDANAEQSGDLASGETFFGYDENGNEVFRILPDGEKETYTYNLFGQVATHADFDGNVATYNYFASGIHAGMLSSINYVAATGSGKANQTVVYTYDLLSRQSTISDASGVTTDLYDSQGNLDGQQTPEGTIWYVFDPVTGKHIETYTNSTDTDYGYNSQGELTTITVKELNGEVLTTPLVTGYAYDAAGNKISESLLPDGEVTRYGYDNLNRLVSMNESQGTTTLFSETFILNIDGTRASAVELQLQPDGSVITLDYAWGYDSDGRLTSESLSATGNTSASSAAAAADDYSDTYSYDLDGNQVTDNHTGAGGTVGTTTNTYNGDDQLTESVIGSTTTQYYYDLNGSQTSVEVNNAVTATFGYDVRNKMVAYSNSAGTISATYVYNDDGDRVVETNTSGGTSTTTYYLTDTQNPTGYAQPLEEHQGVVTGNPSRTYFIGDHVFGQYNTSSSTYNNAALSYLLIDGHGSTQQITNASGSVTAALAYTAYGNALNFSTITVGSVYLFGGDSIYDPISGTYMHGDGTRDAVGFRFIEADSQGNGTNSDPISLHKYLYANGDPVNGYDPTGFYDQRFGYDAEDAIEDVYKLDHPNDTVLYGGWTKLGIPGGAAFRLKPDIFNKTAHSWLEIKPLTYSGSIKAAAQFVAYALLFAPFKYGPEVSWTPSTHYAIAGTTPIFFFNAAGVVFYTSQTDLEEELLALTTLAAVRSFLLSGAGQQIGRSITQILGESIPDLVSVGVGSSGADFGATLGADALLSL